MMLPFSNRSVSCYRSVLSTQTVYSQHYKSLGMLLKVGCQLDLASKLVIIFDDTKEVWRNCNQCLVCVPPKQYGVRSYSFDSTALIRFGEFFDSVHAYVFGQHKGAALPLLDVPKAMCMSYP